MYRTHEEGNFLRTIAGVFINVKSTRPKQYTSTGKKQNTNQKSKSTIRKRFALIKIMIFFPGKCLEKMYPT